MFEVSAKLAPNSKCDERAPQECVLLPPKYVVLPKRDISRQALYPVTYFRISDKKGKGGPNDKANAKAITNALLQLTSDGNPFFVLYKLLLQLGPDKNYTPAACAARALS